MKCSRESDTTDLASQASVHDESYACRFRCERSPRHFGNGQHLRVFGGKATNSRRPQTKQNNSGMSTMQECKFQLIPKETSRAERSFLLVIAA